ncbi:MAG TPA: hypothetical protein VKE41_05125, partial [Roseiflexaceae bacterium]|nr:hypothetical protein [Roseiflexaceae bacterium]
QLPDLIGGIGAPEAEWAELSARAVHAYYAGDTEQALEYAEQARRNAHEQSDRFTQAETAILLGHALARLNRLAEAMAAYGHVLTLFDLPGATHLVAEAWAGLASVALVQSQLAQAQAYIEDVLQALAAHPHAGLDEPFFIYLTCYRVLKANGDPRAATVLQAGQRLLHEYADRITDEALRRSFLENVAAHHELMSAAAKVITLGASAPA